MKSSADRNKQIISISPDVIVSLFELDLSPLSDNFINLSQTEKINLGGTIYRFTSSENGTNPIVWQGNSYQPLPVQIEDVEQKSQGSLPRPKLILANPEGIFSKIVYYNEDFLNCKVTRKRVFARFLDKENFQNRNLNDSDQNPFGSSDSDAGFPDDIFYINKKLTEDKNQIVFELASALELENAMVPARKMMANYCNWTYRCEIGCGYRGLAIENLSGQDLTKGLKSNFGEEANIKFSKVDPDKYPKMIDSIPAWNKYGQKWVGDKWLIGSSISVYGYKAGDLVKISPVGVKNNPYLTTPQVFVCLSDHVNALDYHPFFGRSHWAKDECQKNFESCKKRFTSETLSLEAFNKSPGTQYKPLPFGGFPGIVRYEQS